LCLGISGGGLPINQERKRARFLRDPPPVRLVGLAADLARVASSARHPTGAGKKWSDQVLVYLGMVD